MATKQDKTVQDLFAVIQKKKEVIAKAEKPNWKTNCSFGYIKDSPTGRVNLQVLNDVQELIHILGFLIEKEKAFAEAAKFLDVDAKFDWFGYTLDEWREDVQTRVNKIQIIDKKKTLEKLEARLNSLISPEFRAEMELAEITKMLEG